MLVLIRGAGDLASGIALRLFHAGLSVVMTEIARPTTIRRTVAFSQAVAQGKTQVEDVTARLCQVEDVAGVLAAGEIPVLVDPEAAASPARTATPALTREAAIPTAMLTDSPFSVRQNRSRPRLSVPKKCSRDGGCPACKKFPSRVSAGRKKPSP